MFHLMIVDDQSEIRRGLRTLLDWEELGIDRITEAVDGEEAWIRVRSDPPDIVLCDIRMPRVDGLDLIRRCRANAVHSRFVFVSGYDDFEYVRRAFRFHADDYVLKPVKREELRSIMAQVTQRLVSDRPSGVSSGSSDSETVQELLLNRLLDQTITVSEFREKARAIGCPVIDGRLQLIATNTSFDSSLHGAAHAAAKELGGSVFLDSDGRTIILLSEEGLDATEVSDRLTILHRKLLAGRGRDYRDRVRFGVGVPIGSYRSLHVAHWTAKVVLKWISLTGKSGLCTFADVFPGLDPFLTFSDPEHMELAKVCHSGSAAMIGAVVKALHHSFSSSPDQLARLRNVGATVLLNLLDRHSVTPATVDSAARILERFREQLSVLEDADLTRNSILKVVDQVTGAAPDPTESYGPIVRAVVRQVEKDLDQDVSLKRLAADHGITPAYLGKIFKDQTGAMFTDYVNNLRIQRATGLLSETDLRIRSVGEVVGFGHNINYFYTVFKRLTGVTPTEYRELKSIGRRHQ